MSDAVGDAYTEVAELYASLFLNDLAGDQFAQLWLAKFAACAATQGGVVADLGCGPGHVVHYLTDLGVQAMGYDISPGQLAQARDAFPDLSFELGDLQDLAVADSSLGGICSRYSIIHLELAAHGSAFAEWHRVLAPDAPLLLSFFGAESASTHGESFDHTVATAYALHPATVAEGLEAVGFVDVEVATQPPPDGGRPYDQAVMLARRA